MRKPLSLLMMMFCALFSAQTVMKTTKPIPQKEWENFKSQHEKSLYGDFRILETKGKIAQILGDKPINKLDKASWRPPVIPPLMDADYVGKPIVKSNNNPKFSATNIRPKPVNPNCETCSTIVISENVSKAEMIDIENFLKQYQ